MPALDPRMREELLAAGLANQRQRRFAEAERCYKLVLMQSPRDVDALYRMGVLALQCANAAGAVHYLREASTMRRFDADGWYNLGMAHALDYAFEDAQAAFERALATDPQHASAAVALGNVHKLMGRQKHAADAYLAAVASPQAGPGLFSQILIGLHTNPTLTAEQLFDLHCEWGRRYAQPFYPRAPGHRNDPDPERRLRVGLLSPKFTADIVGHFLRSVAPELARVADLHLYHAGTDSDWLTQELQRLPATWRDIAAMDDGAAAARIGEDAIDVLVDLAGHAPGNRLLLFARRPAPVQITWLDWFDTTGVTTIDAIVSDPITTPPSLVASGAQRFVERVTYVPHSRLCYAPPPFAPDVAPAPASRHGYVTFGSFGRADKILPEVVELWSRVLAAAPGSRLLLKSGGFDVRPVRARLAAAFVEHGVREDRLVFRGASPHREMLAEYAEVDVALDTFPYNGGATTCDALWMGVPVVTLCGERMIARQGAALITAAGYPQWVTADAEAYVAVAADLAADVDRLNATRRGMRARIGAAPLTDAKAFSADLVRVLREEWRRWCAASRDEPGCARDAARAGAAR